VHVCVCVLVCACTCVCSCVCQQNVSLLEAEEKTVEQLGIEDGTQILIEGDTVSLLPAAVKLHGSVCHIFLTHSRRFL